MSESRGGKAASSLLFKLCESFGTQGVAFIVSIVLARLLNAADYGQLGILLVFTALCQVFVQSGLGTALIQKKTVDETDLSSVFYLSLGIAAVLYLLLFFLSPVIARFYHMPALKSTLRVLALVLLPGALLSVQNAVIAREMRFRTLMAASLIATVLSGALGILLALRGCGLWALVAQQLCLPCVQCAVLWVRLSWHPQKKFSLTSIRGLFRFGWKLLAASLLDTGYIKLRSAIIGKQFDADTLGQYTKGQQFPELCMNAVNGSIQSVMLPVLSECQDDPARMKTLMRRSVMGSSYLVLPLMAGLAACAPSLVLLLLGEKWMPCVPFLQICCIDFAFYPIHTANLQAINAMGRSDVFLKLELIKKSYGLLILCFTALVLKNVYAIAWGAVISTLLSAAVNAWPNRRLLCYGYGEQIKDILVPLALSLTMFGAVFLLNRLRLPVMLLLMLQVLCGVTVYGALSLLLKPEGFRCLLDALKTVRWKKSA